MNNFYSTLRCTCARILYIESKENHYLHHKNIIKNGMLSTPQNTLLLIAIHTYLYHLTFLFLIIIIAIKVYLKKKLLLIMHGGGIFFYNVRAHSKIINVFLFIV